MSISANKFVACTYKLYVGEGKEREMMEEATAERPLEYIHGMGMMLADFEKNLFGLKAGDSFDFVLSSEQAYGDHSDENIMDLPREIFTNEDGEFDTVRVVEGNTLPLYTPEGQTVMGTVVEVKEETVLMDFNHPLAGEALHFIGQVVEVHEATSEEIEKFFGGSGGCGCGSSCGCGSDEADDEPKQGCGSGCGCSCGC